MPSLLSLKPADILWLLLTLAVTATFARLGFWQLDRADQKQQILQSYAIAAEIQVTQITAETAVYTKLAGKLKILPQQLFLDNRIHLGQAGIHVLSAALVDEHRLLLINRGWLPFGPGREHLPAAPVPDPAVELSGQLTPFPQVGMRLGTQPELNPNKWPQLITYADHSVIQQAYRLSLDQPELQLLPLVLQLNANAANGFAGRDWSPVNFGPNKHLAYAWQWFTLALAVLITWLVVNRQGNR